MPEDMTEKDRGPSSKTLQLERREFVKGGLASLALLGSGALGSGLCKLLSPSPGHPPESAKPPELLLTEEGLSQLFVSDAEGVLKAHLQLFDQDRLQQQKDRLLASAERQAESILRGNSAKKQIPIEIQGIRVAQDPFVAFLPEIYGPLTIEVQLFYPDYRLSGGKLDISLGRLLAGDKLPEPLKKFRGDTLRWKKTIQVENRTYETDDKRTDLDYNLMRQLPDQLFRNIPANLQWEKRVDKPLSDEPGYPVIETTFTAGNLAVSITISGRGDIDYSWVYLNNPHQIPKLVESQTPTWRQIQEQDIKAKIGQLVRPEIWQKLDVGVARQRTDQPLNRQLALWTTKLLHPAEIIDTNYEISFNGKTSYGNDGRHSQTELVFQLGQLWTLKSPPYLIKLPVNVLPGLTDLSRATRIKFEGETWEIPQLQPDPQIAQWLFTKTPTTWEKTSVNVLGVVIPAIKGRLKLDDETTLEVQIDALGKASLTETKSFYTPNPR
ncbi:hypothetical protein HY388_01770 [Candidatus Daviesbacteria bacterium]|nr:hypothetical protein [Candidatus Daviesbacteria bacterium]